MAATRRLAAVLAADLVGYSRLMGLDEEGTLARLRVLRSDILDPKIAENSGRLVKTTGDGFLVEFNSVIDALRCARDVHAAMAMVEAPAPDRRFMLRIGIHQGDIVVEDGDIFGNGVNIAARLEGIAEPSGICVSERVQEDAAGRIDLVFEDIGEQQLKNIARPIRAYRVRMQPETAVEPAPEHESVPAPAETVPEEVMLAVAEPPVQPVDAAPPIAAEPPAAPQAPAEVEEPALFPLLASSFTGAGELPESAGSSTEVLQARLSEWLGRRVEIVQPSVTWVPLGPAQRSRLPGGGDAGNLNRLGIETTLGLRARRSPAPIVIRIGPLDRVSFEALLPGAPALEKLASLLHEMIGPGAFAINPVLAGTELTPLCLNGTPRRLGWDSWVPPLAASNGVAPDAEDAVFDPAIAAAQARLAQAAAGAAGH